MSFGTGSRSVLLPVVATSLLILASTGAIILASGHRTVAEPVGADFAFAVAEPGGVRLFSVQPHTSGGSAWGWHPCGGRFTADLDRSGDDLRLDLAFHPSPSLGGCAGSGSHDVQIDEGVFIPVDGPPPATVRAPGESPQRVLDPMNGPALGGKGWVRNPSFMTFQTSTAPSGIQTSWDPPAHDLTVTLTNAAMYVGADPEAWLRAGDLGPEPAYWDEIPRSGGDARLRVGGLDLRASFRWGGETTYVAVTAEGGRRVLELKVGGASRGEVRRLVQSIRP
jgi:hypothetical protein